MITIQIPSNIRQPKQKHSQTEFNDNVSKLSLYGYLRQRDKELIDSIVGNKPKTKKKDK